MEFIHQLDEWFATTFVIEYKDGGTTLLSTHTPQLPFIAVALYLIMVFFLPKLLPVSYKDAKGKWQNLPSPWLSNILRVILPLWNLMLCIGSVFIVIGVALPYYRLIRQYGLFEIFCDKEGVTYQGKTGILFWAYLFALSKYVELFDTLWLILKRRPVIFLHWYHHTTVLLFTWFAEYYRLSEGYVFIIVNAFVHTLMYLYYAATSMKYKVPEAISISITVIQITQMFIGVFVNTYWTYLYLNNYNCACGAPKTMVASAILMYGTYLYLFVKFFVNKYFGKGAKKAESGKGGKGGKKPKVQ